jgi:hypothetical protein
MCGVIDEQVLTARLTITSNWILLAGAAMLTFYEEDPPPMEGATASWPSFRRDTLSEDCGATSASRAYPALIECYRFLLEEDRVAADGSGIARPRPGTTPGLIAPPLEVAALQQAIVQVGNLQYARLADEDPDPTSPATQVGIRSASDNQINFFTDSHILLSVAMLDALAEEWNFDGTTGPGEHLDQRRIRRAVAVARQIAQSRAAEMATWNGGKLVESDPVHDFMTYSAIRAFDALDWRGRQATAAGHDGNGGRDESGIEQLAPRLGHRVANDVLRQIAYHSAGIIARFDPAELVFSLALLDRLGTENASQLLMKGIEVVAESQTPDGAWPQSRVVSHGRAKLLHIASYELALTLAIISINRLRDGDPSPAERVLDVLERTFQLVQGSYTKFGRWRGWPNDHTRWSDVRLADDPSESGSGQELIESWATAVVLMFLIRYRDLLLLYRQRVLLGRYDVKRSIPPGDRDLLWPDLAPTLQSPRRFEAAQLDGVSDPTEEQSLRDALCREVLDPIGRNWIGRPVRASLLVLGPPGTRKISLVRALASALEWPLVVLSPPDFLRSRGLESFERTTAAILADLVRIRKAVVLLECEDFFRRRGDEPASGAPGMAGAFVTTGMLPRLQALRDARWLLVVLVSRSQRELDEEAIRPGLFDFRLRLEHPRLKAQQHYAEKWFTRELMHVSGEVTDRLEHVRGVVRDGLRVVDDRRNAELRGETPPSEQMQPVTWDLIQQVVEQAAAYATDSTMTRGVSLPFDSAKSLAARIRELLRPDEVGPPDLPLKLG